MPLNVARELLQNRTGLFLPVNTLTECHNVFILDFLKRCLILNKLFLKVCLLLNLLGSYLCTIIYHQVYKNRCVFKVCVFDICQLLQLS